MDPVSLPTLPVSSDPALLEDWVHFAQSPTILPSSTHSDELEAIRLTNEESIARKNQEGQVIQHRAWKLGEVFRSDHDRLEGSNLIVLIFENLQLIFPLETPTRKRSATTYTDPPIPSSPPTLKMPSLISSPIIYPLSSSPPVNKRPAPVAPLRKPRAIGGFLEDDSDEENVAEVSERPPKRRMLNGQKSPSPLAPRPFEGSEDPLPNPQLQNPPRTRTIGGFLIEGDDEDLDGPDSEIASTTAIPSNDLINYLPNPKLTASSKPSFLFSHFSDRREVRTCAGKSINIRPRPKTKQATFEELVAARSVTKAGKAKKSYYGIDIHRLIDDAAKENRQDESRKSKASEELLPSVEQLPGTRSRRTMMWTEKYRARRFFDLVGDDRTHREVLRWLKGWDPIVFPRSGKPKPTFTKRPNAEGETEEKPHRKILLLTGPPGLGKTTLAHVCATQAGYEIMEINASDERSSNVVKGRIRTTVGTESVKTVGTTMKDGRPQKLARPVCVVVDEVDGVVSGSGGSGEGGFIKALIDLVQLDAKNDNGIANGASNAPRKKKKGDNFRLLRPLILVCNDVYHPSLRPLRQSSFAEVIHMRKPPLEAVVTRMKSVFEKEGVACDGEGVRKLCEATWGMSSGPEARLDSSGTGEGDLRSLLVVGEWVAGKLKSSADAKPKLTRKWVEQNMLSNLSHGGGGARGVGRGGAKEVVSRVFLTGAGFPKSEVQPSVNEATSSDPMIPRAKLHASEIAKKAGMDRLREMVDTSGDIDRIVTDIFSVYPSQPFNDDSILSKPDSAYEWLHFHDACSSRVYSDQDWELMPYLSQPVLACHDLFASPAKHYSLPIEQKKWNNEDTEAEPDKEIPFSGPRADYDAKEAEKSYCATIQELQSSMSATLLRSFRSPEDIATDLLPYLVRMLTPDVKPIIVGGGGDQRGIASVRKEGEREMVRRAVDVMCGFDVKFERGRLEGDFANRGTQWVYRMEP
jgi:chromosome transmission fidelity protein 18